MDKNKPTTLPRLIAVAAVRTQSSENPSGIGFSYECAENEHELLQLLKSSAVGINATSDSKDSVPAHLAVLAEPDAGIRFFHNDDVVALRAEAAVAWQQAMERYLANNPGASKEDSASPLYDIYDVTPTLQAKAPSWCKVFAESLVN